MKNQKETIRRIVGFLNNKDEEGGFWLPNIQRSFVWSDEQIYRLFDSILREYPISTLLIWKTTSPIRRRKFIDNWRSSVRLRDFYVPEDRNKKSLVLDGQQRLQSLFIGLLGSYEGKELYFDLLSGDAAAPDDVKYKFRFIAANSAVFPWVKFKSLVFTSRRKREVFDELKAEAGKELTDAEIDKVDDHLDLIDRTFKMEEAVTYQELDSIDNPGLYTEDDVVEIFIRANSGGTKLGKSDLLFSLLNVSWETADDEMQALLESLNRHGFFFERDFVLKTCLTVLDQGARYEVQKFRRDEVREAVENRWQEIAEAIQAVLDFVRGKTFVRSDKALPSYLVLIPLIYFRFHFPGAWSEAKNLDTYLLRCSLAGAFSGHSDNLINALTKKISDMGRFDIDEIFEVIRSQNKALEITEGRLWGMGYGSDTIYLLFNFWYRDFNYTPAYENNLPQVDHIFPQCALKRVRTENPRTGRKDMMKYRDSDRNQLANCMLLSREENGAGGKGDTLPEDWFRNKPAEYLSLHMIPGDPELWRLERFEDFITARKDIMRRKLGPLLVPSPQFPSIDMSK